LDLAEVGLLQDKRLPENLRWPDRIPELITLLFSSMIQPAFDHGMLTYMRRGYRVVERELLDVELERALGYLRETRIAGLLPETRVPRSAAQVIEVMDQLQGSVWPPVPGSPLRPVNAGRHVIVDLEGATRLLSHLLARPPLEGKEANDWSGHFEEHVQAVVDRGPLAPAAHIRMLRGRTLRLHGSSITDIDALGTLGTDALLLLSCKSVPYSSAYDRGEYRTVRNVSTSAVVALTRWQELIGLVSEHRHGDNYDFTEFNRILGVVVMPFRPFVPIGPATAEVTPGLPAVIGARELEEWSRGLGG
jgi:hypothetical protein